MNTLNLKTWIPELAKTVKKPEMLVHLKAQQFAKVAGFQWGMEMPEDQVATLTVAVTDFFKGGKRV